MAYNAGQYQEGPETHSSSARKIWETENDNDYDRIVRFPDPPVRTALGLPPTAASGEEEEDFERPRRRPRRQPANDSLLSYLATAGVLFAAVGMLAYLLLQLGQLGKQPVAAAPAPAPTALPAQPTAAAQPTAPPAPRPGEGSLRTTSKIVEPGYTVAQGDTLGSIATRFGTSVDALVSINNLRDANSLSINQKLVIPNQD